MNRLYSVYKYLELVFSILMQMPPCELRPISRQARQDGFSVRWLVVAIRSAIVSVIAIVFVVVIGIVGIVVVALAVVFVVLRFVIARIRRSLRTA